MEKVDRALYKASKPEESVVASDAQLCFHSMIRA
jgi:hypothetical protein